MKTELRKINIDNTKYIYSIDNKYQIGKETNILTIKVYLYGHKNTPLVIEFLTMDHYSMGQVLISGINLNNTITNTLDRVNINEPKHIRNFILQGMQNGWIGNNKLPVQNGIDYLNELGYETDIIEPLT